MTLTHWLVLGILTITYTALAVGRIPWLRMNRTSIALAAAMLVVVLGILTEEQAFAAIDLGTLVVLGAMMILNTNLRLAGFFTLVGRRVLAFARTPRTLLGLVILASGLLSALFLNDTICLMFTPLVVDVTRRLKRDPIPYLIGLATATNIGSTATITGNPQNILIGQASGIPYLSFTARLGPVALLGLLIGWVVVMYCYPQEFRSGFEPVELRKTRVVRPLLNRSMIVSAGILVAFAAGAPIVTSAAAGAGLLLMSRLKPRKLLDIDWNLLAFFTGLFVITATLDASGLSAAGFELLRPYLADSIGPLVGMTAVLSNLVSNVPAVLLFRPHIALLGDPTQAWLTLAMASTLAGNLTLLGSAANLIVAELAEEQDVHLSFMAYLRVGVPITLLTLGVGTLWLALT